MVNQFGNNYYQKPVGKRLRDFLFGRNALSRLFLINIIVFILITTANLVVYLYHLDSGWNTESPVSEIAYWLSVPASFQDLLARPWTVFTYMFTHENLLHIFFNMIMFYFGGRIFMEYLGGKKLTVMYIMGGLSGAAFYILAFNTFPVFSQAVQHSVALGASASVLAVLIAIATFVPDYTVNLMFIGRIKLKYIALIFVLLDVINIERSNPGGHIAHLGGALWGFGYILLLKKGLDFGKFFNSIGRFLKKPFKPRPKLRATYNKKPLTDDEYNTLKVERQKKIDAILDKIGKSGYESLTKEEKEMLFKASKNDF